MKTFIAKNTNEALTNEIISSLECLYGALSESLTQQVRDKFSRGEIDSALPKAIAVIRQKYNNFDPDKAIEGYSNIPYENDNAKLYWPSDTMPYPLGAIVPSCLEELLGNWEKVESSVLLVLNEIMLEGCDTKAAFRNTALKSDRLLNCFLEELGRKPQPVSDTIWQEVDEPGSVLGDQAVPACLLMKAWMIMGLDYDNESEELNPDAGLLRVLSIRIKEELTPGYQSSDQTFKEIAEYHSTVQDMRCTLPEYIRRCEELYGLKTQLESRVNDDTQNVA